MQQRSPCIHIETVNFSDGVYELTPIGETVLDGGSLNLTELNQDPDQRSEEPKASFDSAQEGKPRCINPIIFARIYVYIFYICCNNSSCAFKFLGVNQNHRCMLLGTYVL